MILRKKFSALLLTVLLTVLSILTLVPVAGVSAAVVPVTTTPLSGPPGTVVYVYGTGFTVGSNYSIYFGAGVVSGPSVVQGGGTISTYITVPVLSRGTYDIKISTGTDTTATPYPTFNITPQIAIGSTSGKSGDQVTLSGNGFFPSSTITIYFDGVAITPVAPVSTDPFGQFNGGLFVIPQTTGGVHSITASDYGGISPGVNYSISSAITLSATTGAVGSSFNVSGAGFGTNSVISFTLDGTALSGNTTTDAQGKFANTSLVVPSVAGGTHVISAKDTLGNSANTNFIVTGIFSISPASGPVDTSVVVSGKGFLPNSHITVTYDGSTITAISSTLSSDASGNFSAGFKVPASSTGGHIIAASDGTNNINATFTSQSTAASSPVNGPVGTAVTVTGTGFKTSSKVTVTFNGVQIATGNAAANGSFSVTFNVPAAAAGSHDIVVSDGTTSKPFTFAVTPTVSMTTAATGFIGDTISIAGTGFISGKALNVTYDGNAVTLITANATDANGSFSVSFKAPVSKSGSHPISISDGTNSQNYTFTIDATPPAAPTPTLPLAAGKLGKVPMLTWTTVADNNGGITYNLQVSKDATFKTAILQKTGLTTPTYTLDTTIPAEKLKAANANNPYYWRVQSVDAAGNTGAWSTPQTFIVGLTFADYSIYILFAGIAIMLGIIGFVLGRLTAKR